MFEYQLDYSTMKATPTRKKKKRNENQAPNVSFQSSTGIVKRKTPRKKKMLKESKSQRKKKAKKSNTQTLTPPATTTTTATATATATRPATKTTTQKDDHVDVHYYSSSVANSYHQNQHSVTVSNGEVVLDIPQDFTFSHSEDDDENDDDDDDDDDEEEHPSSRHQRKRSSWRRSNALNEDRYDFCLVVDTVKGTEKNESNNKNSKNNDTPNDAATRNAPSCCACLCFKTKGKNQGTKDDDDGTTAIASINGEEDDDDNTQQQQQQTILDMSPTPPTTTHDDYDPATAYNHAPMQQLQLQRRRARRHGALKKEDDDKAKVSSSTSSSTSSTSPSATTTATTFATPDESIRVDHTGIGLSGQRMVSLIRSKLRHAGLLVKRVQNLTGTRTLLKVRASQSRLEQEAERMRLVMRTKDGGYARFKQSDRHAFCGAGYYSDSNDHVLFRSSDRQSILLHIIKSSRDVGGAQLSPHVDPCGDAIVMMFPVHMVLRILELKRSWSTAFFCCRTPPTSRYGSVQRGKQYQQSDAGKLLSSMKFRFEEGKKPKHNPYVHAAMLWYCGQHGGGLIRVLLFLFCSFLCLLFFFFLGGDGTEENEENQENEREAQVGDCRNPCKSKHCCTWATVYDLFTFGWLVRQPLDAISEYYGETIGFYFAFLEFYTIWLAMPTAAGIVLFCFQVYEQRIDHWLLPFYSLFVGLWSMFFLVRWRRRRIELAYRWGVMDHEEEEIERIEFKGTTRTSTVTGAEERYYSPTKRTLKQIFITIPVTIVWLVAIVWLYLYLFDTRDSIMDKFQSQQQNASATMQNDTVSALPSTNVGDASNRRMSSSFLNFQTSKTPGTSMSLSLSDRHVYGSDIQFWLYLLIPPILCGGLIPLLNVLYLKLATKLNDFENHKTESSYQFNLIGKIQQCFFFFFLSRTNQHQH